VQGACLYGCSLEQTDTDLVPKPNNVARRRLNGGDPFSVFPSRKALSDAERERLFARNAASAADHLMHEAFRNVGLSGDTSLGGWAAKADLRSPALFAHILAGHAGPIFAPKLCKYSVRKAKTGSARVVFWRELGLVACYTLETTFCSAASGPLRNSLLQPRHFEALGCSLSAALWDWLLLTEHARTQQAALGLFAGGFSSPPSECGIARRGSVDCAGADTADKPLQDSEGGPSDS
jgi:hypothetical protein